jgi:hypothetical protein
MSKTDFTPFLGNKMFNKANQNTGMQQLIKKPFLFLLEKVA